MRVVILPGQTAYAAAAGGILAKMLSAKDTELAIDTGMVAVRTTRDVVVVAGPDAASYLHGQVSQNIEKLEIGASAWTFLLEPQGRICAWARATRVDGETFWLDTDQGFGQQMLERLERFKLRTKASFALFEASVLSVRGPATASNVDVTNDDGSFKRPDEAVVASLGWPGLQGFDVLSPQQISLADFLPGVEEGAPEALESSRIRAGIPKMGRELGEKTIPAEAGIVDLAADFSKGCYVGQELVARIDSRGNNTPRRVLPLAIDGSVVPRHGAALTVDGKSVGTITSAADSQQGIVALGSIKRGVDVPSDVVVDIEGSPVSARLSEAHWARDSR